MKIKCIKEVYHGHDLKVNKVYEARQGQKGWYSLVDESGETYAYPPELFEVIEDDLMKYYNAHKSEHEIMFLRQSLNYQNILSIWECEFDDIMNLIKPKGSDWKGLARTYHSKTGWYEGGPWKIPFAKETLEEFKSLEDESLLIENTKELLKQICDFLEKAVKYDEDVWLILK